MATYNYSWDQSGLSDAAKSNENEERWMKTNCLSSISQSVDLEVGQRGKGFTLRWIDCAGLWHCHPRRLHSLDWTVSNSKLRAKIPKSFQSVHFVYILQLPFLFLPLIAEPNSNDILLQIQFVCDRSNSFSRRPGLLPVENELSFTS